MALGTHIEPLPGPSATDMEPLFSVEAGLPWDPHAFNSLNVTDKFLKNGKGDQTAYQLILPLERGYRAGKGPSRTTHAGPGEVHRPSRGRKPT